MALQVKKKVQLLEREKLKENKGMSFLILGQGKEERKLDSHFFFTWVM